MRKMLILLLVALLHRLDRALAASYFESLAVRQQMAVLNRKTPRPRLHPSDRWFWVLISGFWPDWRHALAMVKPATVIGWHRNGLAPPLDLEVALASQRTAAGLAGGSRPHSAHVPRESVVGRAPRIQGEPLKLGFDVSERTVSRYIRRHPKPPSQTWRRFLENHVGCLASMDSFVVWPQRSGCCTAASSAAMTVAGSCIVRRARHRFDPARMSRSYHRPERTPSSPDPGILPGLFSSFPMSPVARQGCALRTAPCGRSAVANSWRFHKSADLITATSASRPDPGLAYGHGYC